MIALALLACTESASVRVLPAADDEPCEVAETVVGADACGVGAAMHYRGEAPGDWAGDAVRDAGDLDGDGRSDLAIGATRSRADAGAVELVQADGPGEASLAEAPGRLVGQPGESLGYDLAAVPGGLVIGAPGAGDAGGRAVLVLGPVRGTHPVDDLAVLVLRGAAGDKLASVASGGDVDGDGVADLVLGAIGDGPGGVAAGYVAVVSGAATGEHAVADAARTVLLGAPGSHTSEPASVGDLDGDGLADLVAGAEDDPTGGEDAGAVRVLYSPLPVGILTEADVTWLGRPTSIAGHVLDGLGDADGDGLADLVIGAPYDDPAGDKSGSTYVVSGLAPSGRLPDVAVATLQGEEAGIRAGYSVAWAHDLDGDGADDLAIGAKFDRTMGVSAGAVYVALGPFAGVSSLADARLKLLGEAEGDHLGDVSAVEDADGDGVPDLVAGARHAGADAGAAFVVFGPW